MDKYNKTILTVLHILSQKLKNTDLLYEDTVPTSNSMMTTLSYAGGPLGQMPQT